MPENFKKTGYRLQLTRSTLNIRVLGIWNFFASASSLFNSIFTTSAKDLLFFYVIKKKMKKERQQKLHQTRPKKIITQAICKTSFSTDLTNSLEFREFYALAEASFLEFLFQSFTRPNSKRRLNFGKFYHCSKWLRLGCDIIVFAPLYSLLY